MARKSGPWSRKLCELTSKFPRTPASSNASLEAASGMLSSSSQPPCRKNASKTLWLIIKHRLIQKIADRMRKRSINLREHKLRTLLRAYDEHLDRWLGLFGAWLVHLLELVGDASGDQQELQGSIRIERSSTSQTQSQISMSIGTRDRRRARETHPTTRRRPELYRCSLLPCRDTKTTILFNVFLASLSPPHFPFKKISTLYS